MDLRNRMNEDDPLIDPGTAESEPEASNHLLSTHENSIQVSHRHASSLHGIAPRGAPRKCSVTIEPVVFLYSVFVAMSNNLTQLFLYDIIAGEYNTSAAILRNESSCVGGNVTTGDSDGSTGDVRWAVQAEAANWSAVLGACQLPVALLATVLMGGYSDLGGRRPIMVLATVGSLLRVVLNLTIVFTRISKAWLILASVLEAFGGGFVALLMAMFAYLSDITSHENRAFRIVLVEASLGLGITTGLALSGYLLKAIGYGYCFVLLAGVLLVILLYVLLLLPESRVITEKPPVFSVKHVARVKDVYMKDDGNRWRLWVGLLMLVCHSIAELGRFDAFNYYVLNSPFCWDPVMIGYYGAAGSTLSSLGSILATKVLERRLADMGLLVLGAVFAIATNLITGFSSTTWLLYAAALTGMFGQLPIQMLRSYNSKLVSPQDQGSLYSAIAWIQVTASLGGRVLLSSVYMLTLSQLAGATFIVAAGFDFISCIMGLFVIFKDKQRHAAQSISVTESNNHD